MHRTAVFLLVVLALLFAACGPQSAAPVAQPPVTASAVPSRTPTLTPAAFSTVTPEPSPTVTETPTETPVALPAAACLAAPGIPFAFYLDNDHLLSREDPKIYLTDLKTGQVNEFLSVQLPEGVMLAAAALSPNADRLALSLSDYTIRVYQTADKKLLHTLTGHFDIINKLVFSPDGERLYSGSHDQTVHVWDRAGNDIGAFQATGADDFPSDVMGLGVSPDGKLLATIPFDGPTKIWDAQKFTLVRSLSGSGGYDNGLAIFSPDGQYLAAITANGLFLWRVADGEELMGGNPGINAMAISYSPDGRYFVYFDISNSQKIYFRSMDGSQDLGSLPNSEAPVWDLVFSSDSALLVTASNIESHVWRIADGVLLTVIKPQCP